MDRERLEEAGFRSHGGYSSPPPCVPDKVGWYNEETP
jgi:hypothetical protein